MSVPLSLARPQRARCATSALSGAAAVADDVGAALGQARQLARAQIGIRELALGDPESRCRGRNGVSGDCPCAHSQRQVGISESDVGRIAELTGKGGLRVDTGGAASSGSRNRRKQLHRDIRGNNTGQGIGHDIGTVDVHSGIGRDQARAAGNFLLIRGERVHVGANAAAVVAKAGTELIGPESTGVSQIDVAGPRRKRHARGRRDVCAGVDLKIGGRIARKIFALGPLAVLPALLTAVPVAACT